MSQNVLIGVAAFLMALWATMSLDRKKELVSVGGGRPAIAHWISQTANAVWTLFITWILWSGTFFTPPIIAD
jgi:hypothetical protein